MQYLNTDCPYFHRVCVDGFGMLKCKNCVRKEEKAMAQPTQKEINKAIKACKWRQNFMGSVICSGMCGPCARVIENGECDTLKKMFAGKENSNAEDNTDNR